MNQITKQQIHKLFQRETTNLVGFLTMLTGDRHVADDLFQETCLEALRISHKYDPEANFGAWLRSIARYQVLRYWRKRHHEKIVFYSDELLDQLEAVWQESSCEITEDYGDALQSCVDELKPLPREVLDKRYQKRYSCEEIAKEIDRTPNAVKMMLCRLRKKLKSCVTLKIGNHGENYGHEKH